MKKYPNLLSWFSLSKRDWKEKALTMLDYFIFASLFFPYNFIVFFISLHAHVPLGGTAAMSVEHETPDQEVVGSIPALATSSLLVGSVSV